MSDSEGKGGSWLYRIILILSGGLILITGILNFIGFNPLTPYLPAEYQYLANVTGYTNITIGFWGLIAGVGLIKDQEWGWGISLVVLSIVIVPFTTEVIISSFNFAVVMYDPNYWIKLVALIIATIGIVYLLATKKRYK